MKLCTYLTTHPDPRIQKQRERWERSISKLSSRHSILLTVTLIAAGLIAFASFRGTKFTETALDLDHSVVERSNVQSSAESSISFPGQEADARILEMSDAAETVTLLWLPDDSIVQMLEPWVSEFRANLSGADHFEEYEILAFDDDSLRRIRDGEVSFAEFNFSNSDTYTISIRNAVTKENDWYFNGRLLSDSNGVTAITVFPDGRKWGEIHVPGKGLYIVRPTNVLPYHIVYLATGVYDID